MSPTTTPATQATHPDQPPITAVTYHRIASTGRDGRATLDRQLEATRRRAAELGATIVEEFTDTGLSGRTINRPGLQRMLAHLARQDATYCIVKDLAGLTRDPSTYVDIHDTLTQAGVTLISCESTADDTHPRDVVHQILVTAAAFTADDTGTGEVSGASRPRTTHASTGRVR